MANAILPANRTDENVLGLSLSRCDAEVQSATNKIAAMARAASQLLLSSPDSWQSARMLLNEIEDVAQCLCGDVDEIAERHGCYRPPEDEATKRLIGQHHAPAFHA